MPEGRGLKDEKGAFIGNAPACIVDLKARSVILSITGTKYQEMWIRLSPMGQAPAEPLSALLGTTGNHPDYEPYLEEIGAAEETDDVYAPPVTVQLQIWNMRIWHMNGNFVGSMITTGGEKSGVMSEEQKKLSAMEKLLFPSYLNSLKLVGDSGRQLTLKEDGKREL